MSLFKKKAGPENPIIIAGLGNLGSQYHKSRHNAGFLVTERLAERLGLSWKKGSRMGVAAVRLACFDPAASPGARPGVSRGLSSQIPSALLQAQRALLLLQPLAFMNLSGAPVASALRRFKSSASELLVIHDEIELPFGRLSLQLGGGHRGHNGIRDIHARLEGRVYHRLRFGVGRPPDRQVADYVLSPFSPQEWSDIGGLLDQACDLCLQWATALAKDQ